MKTTTALLTDEFGGVCEGGDVERRLEPAFGCEEGGKIPGGSKGGNRNALSLQVLQRQPYVQNRLEKEEKEKRM